MKTSIVNKLEQLRDRYEELAALLADPDIIADQDQFRKFSMEYAEIEPVAQCYGTYEQLRDDLQTAQEMLQDSDADMRELAQEEAAQTQARIATLEENLQRLLLPKDPHDTSNTYLEIRAGTGGDEAAIFAGDLFRMYSRYAENRGWRIEVVSESLGDHGGFKEIITRVVGKDVYGKLKFESGAHRVQRVPETESQGRIHTSACTVAIMPEVDELDEIEINRDDLRIDTFRASGAGGQHVNKTDSAIRLTHLPTGIVVECQDERSQHKNRAKAMSLLQAKLLSSAQEQQQSERADARKLQVGSGDRSERIRTYNFPEGRVTDHRINLVVHRLKQIMEGDLSCIIDPLISEHQADLLARLSAED